MFEVEAGADEKQQIKFVWPNVLSRSDDPQKNRRKYLITRSILKMLTPHRSSLQRRSFDIIYIYISAVSPKNKKLAVLP